VSGFVGLNFKALYYAEMDRKFCLLYLSLRSHRSIDTSCCPSSRYTDAQTGDDRRFNTTSTSDTCLSIAVTAVDSYLNSLCCLPQPNSIYMLFDVSKSI
jgi:hypothetical protein